MDDSEIIEKTIEIPATLRIRVPASMSEHDMRQIEKEMASESTPTVDEGVLEGALKEHLEAFDVDSTGIISADLWVF